MEDEEHEGPQVNLLEHEEQSSDEPNEQETSTGPTRITLIALTLATILASLDAAILTTVLPTIASHFNASHTTYSWVGSAYLLPYAALSPWWAKLSDVFGRKGALLAATAVFTVGSLICGISMSSGMLIAGRAVQGTGGGGLTCLVQIIIGDLASPRYVSLIVVGG